MARLIPEVDPETISLKPERDVARALVRDLPDDCLVYHSYCWLRPDRDYRGEPIREGETDFLVIYPKYGILLIEVKGGDIRHRIEDDSEVYFRKLSGNRTKDIKHPVRQASKNFHAITQILGIDKEQNWFGGCYGYAVSFPDQANREVLPNDLENSIVFLAQHLDDMDRAVRGALKNWNNLQNPSISSDALRICRERLRPVFRLFPAKWRELETDEENLITLTEQQKQVLEGLSENPRLAVRGGAGTGKTLLALWRAVEYAKTGNETLFLCFNKQLAAWLNDRADTELQSEVRKRLRIYTFHSLCAEFYRRAGAILQPPTNEDASTFWAETVPNKMFDSILDQVAAPRFDAIVVDEAQDFRKDWWIVVETLSRTSSGPLAIFYDPNQNIFCNENELPRTGTLYRLNVNCRNTRAIHSYSTSVVNAEISPSIRSPQGVDPTEEFFDNEKEQREACEQIIKSWRSDYRIESDRLAILSNRRIEGSCLSIVNGRVAGQRIVQSLEDWRSGKGILFSTISSFKGLEADAVILLVSEGGPTPTPSDIYVATSRAKHLLAVFTIG